MAVTTLSSREFNQDTNRAKKATRDGPVFITDRGKPAHVLLSIEEYRRLTHTGRTVADVFGMPPGVEDVEFDPPRTVIVSRPADLS
ncbi:type II toxin-antitoxin system Phd/YefM family antitoxin [Labrys wisconsinensis]|uniref:Antitoxin n=1 Tax=Labrys wisconsinensis TaxID=425677 RepID=A0ABU0JGI7_9HYPH|nr:type II toxin-antitoxin system Phd/YefM family antitoxin [Labrys wisconsinensis]MDQ0473393.1 prevent-host-death family protein [Labrys wisconsinensis]